MMRDPAPALVLASGSPRRLAFMRAVGVPVVVRPVAVEEVPAPGEGPLSFCRRMAEVKAIEGYAARAPEDPPWVLGSDTVVTVDGRILGKPADAEEATRMLGALSGRTHHVITAWALAGVDGVEVGHTRTAVSFRPAAAAEIAAYVATGDPLDKAGAYGIQSGAGRFVVGLEGSYDGVVGLPLAEVCDHLARRGVVSFPFGLAPRAALLRGRIAAAAVAAGRGPEAVTLVAVTKGQSVEKIACGLDLGLTVLGESYVQEWQRKREALAERGPSWHFIGHLQRNKARVAAEAARVHSVDSARLAHALGRAAVARGRVVPALLQVDLAGEESKGGVPVADVACVLDEVCGIEGLAVDGLMAIPPAGDAATARGYFAALRRLRDACATAARPLPHLSMGMSGDYREAIAEGATLVRVGSALYGPRS